MATTSSVVYPDYTSIASIKRYWTEKIAPDYFDFTNTNNYNVGVFGYVNEVMGEATEDAFNTVAIARREFYPITAQFTSSLYAMATLQNITIPLTSPAVCKAILVIPQSEIIEYSNDDDKDGLYECTIDNTLKIFAGDLQFMLDYPIKILSRRNPANNTWTHTVHYDISVKNSLNTSEQRYISNKVIKENGVNYVALFIDCIRQLEMTEFTNVVVKDTVLDTVTMDIDFDGNLANFEVFYKENSNSEERQLEKAMVNAAMPATPFVNYELVNPQKLRLTFTYNGINGTIPQFNSEIITRVYTSQGSSGNFNRYTEDLVCSSDSEEYRYNSNMTILGIASGSATGGADQAITEEFRRKVLKAYATNETITTEKDLQLYFDDIADDINGVNILFKKKRDDVFIRLFGAYGVYKDDNNNIIPTNTLKMICTKSNLVDDLTETGTRFVIPTGTIFKYKDTGIGMYKIPKGRNYYVTTELIDVAGQTEEELPVIKVTNEYGTITIEEAIYYVKMSDCIVANRSIVVPITQDGTETGAPRTAIDILTDSSFLDADGRENIQLFTNPFLCVISTKPNNIGYYLNSLNVILPIEYTMIEDRSSQQFIGGSVTGYRNAMLGSNYYKFSITLAPASDVEEGYIAEIPDLEDEANILRARFSGVVEHEELYENPITITHESETKTYYAPYVRYTLKYDVIDPETGDNMREYVQASNISPVFKNIVSSTKWTGWKMQFNVGDAFTANDIIATKRPKDNGKLIIAADLGGLIANGLYMPMSIQEVNEDQYTLEGYISTTDEIDVSGRITLVDGICDKSNASTEKRYMALNIEKLRLTCNVLYINTEYNPPNTFQTFADFHDYSLTNTYITQENQEFDLAKPLIFVRSNIDYKPLNPEDPEYNENYYIICDEIPLLGARWAFNQAHFDYFVSQYTMVNDILNGAYYSLENTFSIDCKFYNTYGRARFYTVGNDIEDMEMLDSVRCIFRFGINLSTISLTENFVSQIKAFIKNYVETAERVTTEGQDLYILNLTAAMEAQFSEIQYVEYYGFNSYNYKAQKIIGPDLDEYHADFIPEFLNIDVTTDANGDEVPNIQIGLI